MIEKEFEDGVVEVTDIKYHRGIIPIFKGKISLSWQNVQRELKMTKEESELLEWYYDYNLWDRNFTSSYTEFLYRGGPDLGYNLEIDYLEVPTVDELKEEIEYLHDETFLGKEEFLANRLAFLAEKINEYYYRAEKVIYKMKEQYEKDISPEPEKAGCLWRLK